MIINEEFFNDIKDEDITDSENQQQLNIKENWTNQFFIVYPEKIADRKELLANCDDGSKKVLEFLYKKLNYVCDSQDFIERFYIRIGGEDALTNPDANPVHEYYKPLGIDISYCYQDRICVEINLDCVPMSVSSLKRFFDILFHLGGDNWGKQIIFKNPKYYYQDSFTIFNSNWFENTENDLFKQKVMYFLTRQFNPIGGWLAMDKLIGFDIYRYTNNWIIKNEIKFLFQMHQKNTEAMMNYDFFKKPGCIFFVKDILNYNKCIAVSETDMTDTSSETNTIWADMTYDYVRKQIEDVIRNPNTTFTMTIQYEKQQPTQKQINFIYDSYVMLNGQPYILYMWQFLILDELYLTDTLSAGELFMNAAGTNAEDTVSILEEHGGTGEKPGVMGVNFKKQLLNGLKNYEKSLNKKI